MKSMPALAAMRVIPGVLNSKIHVPMGRLPSLRACFSSSVSNSRSSKLLGSNAVRLKLGAESRPLEHRPVNHVLRNLAAQHCQHGLDGRFAHHAKALISPGDRMRSEDNVIEFDKRITGRKGCHLKYIQGCATNSVFFEGSVESMLINDWT